MARALDPSDEWGRAVVGLHQRIRRNPAGKALHRLHCVVLLLRGFSCEEVANAFGQHPRTVERWRVRYREMGPDGLLDLPRQGRPARLSEETRTRLENDLQSPPSVFGYDGKRWSGELIQQHLELRYRVTFSRRHCQRLARAFVRAR